jgi:hypothetical protein
MRAAICLCLAVVLAGCQRNEAPMTDSAVFALTSRTALFAGPGLVPGLRNGVWLGVSDVCTFDQALPTARWPACADEFLVQQGRITIVVTGRRRPARVSEPYVVSTGEPHVLQLRRPGRREIFDYSLLRPLERDASGFVTGVDRESIECYHQIPDPSGRETSHGDGSDTRFEIIQGFRTVGSDCVTDRAYFIYAAARLTSAHLAPTVNARWVRDGDR